MNLSFFKSAYLTTVISMLVISCGGKYQESLVLDLRDNNGAALKVDDDTTNVAVSSGALAGASVKFATGAIAVDTTIAINSVSQPQAFSVVNGQSASSAVSYTATDAGGQQLSSAQQTMTIAIPVSGATGLVASGYAGLCVLAEPADKLLAPIVWRRDAIQVENNRALIETMYFGVFQAIYCGDTVLAGFDEVDVTPPVITALLSAQDPGPVSAAILNLTVTFSEDVTGFDLTNINVTNGAASNLTGSGNSYTFDVTGSVGGMVAASIDAGVITDLKDNLNVDGLSWSIEFDDTLPSVALSSQIMSPTNVSVLPVDVVFSENVSGLELGDIVVDNGTAANLSGSGMSYAFDIVADGSGVVTAQILVDAVQDASGNPNGASNQWSIIFDDTPPSAVISSVKDPGPTSASVIPVNVSFNEEVTGFDLSDITIVNGTKDNFSGSGKDYSFDIILPTGFVTAVIGASAAADAAGNLTVASATWSILYEEPICGSEGDSCYDDVDAMSAGLVTTPRGKNLIYEETFASSEVKVWKEVGGGRILVANGMDEWAKETNLDGKGFGGDYFTNPALIAGRVCPPNVYLDDDDKFTTDNCVYYTAASPAQNLNAEGFSQIDANTLGMENWNVYTEDPSGDTDPRWYVGNIKVCADNGMRLPTLYETSANGTDLVNGHPLADGNPIFAAGAGVPNGDPSTSKWTASAFSTSVDNYWRWLGSSSTNDIFSDNNEVVCVLPGIPPITCGGPGDSCYDDIDAITAGSVTTPQGKNLVYVHANGSSGVKIWKEDGGDRILRANGMDQWANETKLNGKGLSSKVFNDASLITGRACPNNVYIDDDNKFTTDNCLYYTDPSPAQKIDDAGASQVDINILGLMDWNNYTNDPTGNTNPRWYVGNIKTCADKGMRLPTLYETSAADNSSNAYPTSDGNPLFTVTGGIPNSDPAAWRWTASAHTSSTEKYWLWRGSASTFGSYFESDYEVVCVLP